jgi:hypothetical protein
MAAAIGKYQQTRGREMAAAALAYQNHAHQQ